jgi:hypothetical protein
MRPPSTELRASLSGCHAKIPFASPLYTVEHGVENRPARNFGGLLFNKFLNDI